MEAVRSFQRDAQTDQSARIIAIHSLRGGTGASTLAVNLSMGLTALWKKPTALLDFTMTAGQVAMMLNMSLKRTWTDIARFSAAELDVDAVMSIIGTHESGLSFIAAPTVPSEAEALHSETLGTALRLLKGQFEYLIADLPHDFSEPAIQALDVADTILMVATPDMASIRASVAVMDTYEKLGYKKEKIKLVLNAIFPRSSLSKEKIESALGMTAVMMVPYVPDVFVDAINLGQPPVFYRPHESVSALLEDFALLISKDDHKKSKPENPTAAWKRVYQRYQERKKR
jgi:pilus assembly protein CpaE